MHFNICSRFNKQTTFSGGGGGGGGIAGYIRLRVKLVVYIDKTVCLRVFSSKTKS